MTIATWNVRTLLDNENSERPQRRTALIAAELQRYNVDIAALTETRLSGEGSLEEIGGGYTFYWRGVPNGERRIHGVAFAIRTKLLRSITESPRGVSECIISWRLPFCGGANLSIVCGYAPTLVADAAEKKKIL